MACENGLSVVTSMMFESRLIKKFAKEFDTGR
jgi:hypothetical protein